jgi:rhodanese-related sulfurtransferase
VKPRKIKTEKPEPQEGATVIVPTITKEDLKAKIDRGEKFRLVDVRDTPDYKRAHIVGAAHLLIAEMSRENAESMFHKNDLIVTYSLDENCPAKRIAARRLLDYGFTHVLAYEGSWKEWKAAGYPTEQ